MINDIKNTILLFRINIFYRRIIRNYKKNIKKSKLHIGNDFIYDGDKKWYYATYVKMKYQSININ